MGLPRPSPSPGPAVGSPLANPIRTGSGLILSYRNSGETLGPALVGTPVPPDAQGEPTRPNGLHWVRSESASESKKSGSGAKIQV